MPPRASGKVARVRLVEPQQGNLFGDGAELVRQALHPGQTVERYGRIWHLGQITEENGYLFGRLGYENRVGADLWQEEAKDFEKARIENGLAAPFVIRLSDLVIVFQPRKQEIRPISFAGALRSMLTLGKSYPNWGVEPLTGEVMSFATWRHGVDVVTRLRFRVEQADTLTAPISRVVHQIMAGCPDWASLEWRADIGLDTDAPLIQELLADAGRGVGELVAVGRSATSPNVVRRWSSQLGDESLTTEVDAMNDDGEVSHETLLAQLEGIEPHRTALAGP
ncbi:hypothetical protein ACN28C_15860 [Plantactinospora sp. WMMC1484]|uniref:hypothetical protein n=1 Tax=Plantactinospora sp. WMMC1484 TaxID=3404122 RepID=UPI003BF5971F